MPEGSTQSIGPDDDRRRLTGRRLVLFLALLVLALFLRRHDLAEYPAQYQTFDEYHYLCVGLSLLHEGRPTAWSPLSSYLSCGVTPRKVHILGGARVSMVCPALDHPPLFSLVAGAFAQLTGARRVFVPQPEGGLFPLWDVDLGRARHLSLLLFAFSLFFLFEIARRAFSFDVACVAALFYGVIAHVVFQSRLIVTENLTTPLFLLNLYYLQRYVDGRSTRAGFGAATIVSTAAALLCKLVAVSQAAAVVYLLFLYRRRRDVVYPVVGVALGAALYLAYGWWQGWDVFWAVLSGQAGRFYGFNALVRIVTDPAVVHTPNLSYLLLLGWIALFGAVLYRRGTMILAAPLLYLLGFVFFASLPAIYGWHIVPFYPFLCLALALLVVNVYRRCRPVEFAALMVALAPAAFDAIRPLADSRHPALLRGGCLLIVAATLTFPFFRRPIAKRLMQSAILITVTILVLQEICVAWTHSLSK